LNDVSAQNNFDALLTLLDADREVAGAKYEELRLRLERFFEWRGCDTASDLADVCIDRVLKKISEGEVIQNVQAFAATIAQFVYKESLRSKVRMTDSLDAEDTPEIAAVESTTSEDERMSCLETCLNEFRIDDRRLIVSYYDTDEKTMIASRKRLADSLAVSINTLRIKVCRLKSRLEKCTKDCCREA
jgi:DNA-directed RNA polymerase specialized sigma24 family protein